MNIKSVIECAYSASDSIMQKFVTPYSAVRMGFEPIAADRQSAMFAITLTNH